MASGKNLVARLKDTFGDGVGRVDVPRVPLDWLTFHPKGHKLRHPRAEDPVDEELRDSIVERGVDEPFVVRLEYEGDEALLRIIDGACRKNSGTAAQEIMRKNKSKLLVDNNLLVKIKLFNSDDDAEVLLERQRYDRDPLKRQHSLRVLAVSVVQMMNLEIEPKRILEVLPREWNEKIISAVALGWHTLDPKLVKRLDVDGISAVILPALLKAPPSKRHALLDEFLTQEPTSVAWATRIAGNFERASSEEAGSLDEDDSIENDGLAAFGDDGDGEGDGEGEEGNDGDEGEGEGDEGDGPESGTKKTAAKTTDKAAQPRPTRTKTPVEKVRPKTIEKLYEHAKSKSKLSDAELAFVTGARASRGDKAALASMVKDLKELPAGAQHALAGVFWAMGVFGTAIQGMVNASVLESITVVTDKPAPQGEKKTKGRKAKAS